MCSRSRKSRSLSLSPVRSGNKLLPVMSGSRSTAARSTPATSKNVGATSRISTTASTTDPGATKSACRDRGHFTTNGTCVEPSAGKPFLHKKWSPIISPWSDVHTTYISSRTPRSSSLARIRPTCSSTNSMDAK